MKHQKISTFALIGLVLLMTEMLSSCQKQETFAKATVETNQVTSVTEATATCGGVISADGGSNVTVRGVCWSTLPNPSVDNDTTIDAAGTGSFTSSIKGLSPNTTYYVRAYALNKGSVAYGLQMIFTTKTFSITTSSIAISLISATSAIGGGNIISDGDSSILTVKARGVCWNIFPSPTIENSKTLDGVGGGRFTSHIDSLTAFVTYYVRAYATNSNGTIYGNEVSFTTLSGEIGLTTDAVSSITAYTANCGGAISNDGGATVTARGVCWSTLSTPTIYNLKTSNGSGSGTFTSSITGLTPCTTYYVRSYATNSVGTIYGNQQSFTTITSSPSLITSNVTSVTSSTATCSGTISSNGGATIKVSGVCWSTTQNPTITDSKSTDGLTFGTFTSSMTGLTPNTTYFARAYATNSVGTAYGNEEIFTTQISVTDIDGNVYSSVKLGTQVWLAENLKTTKYNDGKPIPLVTDATAWFNLSTPGYCYFENNVANKNINGALYNWYTINTGNLAPTGWHIPTDAEWTTLTTYLINNRYGYEGHGSGIAKSLASTSGWISNSQVGRVGNEQASNNSSGFTGLPGGYRYDNGAFTTNFGFLVYWWSSDQYNTYNAWHRYLLYDSSTFNRNNFHKKYGLSVRCVRDN